MTARRPIPLAPAMFRVVGCSGQPGSHAHHGGPAVTPAAGEPVVFDNLADYHRPVTATSRQAQAYVDQRLRLRRAWARADVRPTSSRF